MSFAGAWMPLYGDDFWESERVAAMDDQAVCLYQWLLWRQFKHGPLPAPAILRRLPHRWQANWDEVWPQVAACFDVTEEGRLSNPKCAELAADAHDRAERASNNGRRGGLSKQPLKGSSSNPSSPAQATLEAPLEQPLKQKPSKAQALNEPNRTEPNHPNTSPPASTSPEPVRKRPPREPTGEHATFTAWWGDAFERAVGSSYGHRGAQDGEHVKRILTRGGIEEAKRRAAILFGCAPEWMAKGGIDLGTLDQQWNKLVSAGNVQVATGSKQAAVRSLAPNGHALTIPPELDLYAHRRPRAAEIGP